MGLKALGKICQDYRKSIRATQDDVARETGYSRANIASFETGRVQNARIMLWYLFYGLDTGAAYEAIRGDDE